MASTLDVGPGALLADLSAAAVWGVPGTELAPHHVMEVRDGAPRRSELAVVHRLLYLPGPVGTVVDGLPVVRPSVMLLQIAAHLHGERLARIVDGLWARRLVSGRSLRRDLGPLLARGRSGSAAMRLVLDARSDAYVPPASGLEGRVASILRRSDLPPMRRQVDLGDDDDWCGRVDFVADDVPVVLEVDSDRYHAALTDRAADERRQRRLERAGFVVARVEEVQVWHRPGEVVEAVRRARRQALGGRAVA